MHQKILFLLHSVSNSVWQFGAFYYIYYCLTENKIEINKF